jgi:hypothetical protein
MHYSMYSDVQSYHYHSLSFFVLGLAATKGSQSRRTVQVIISACTHFSQSL